MNNEMVQQVITAPHEIMFQTVPVPQPNADEVLIRIHMIGLCGSDIHVYHGEHPFTKYPITQGHEVSGEIVALGANVTEFAVGQKVTIEPQIFCGSCYPCTHGKYNLCENLKVMGFQSTGAASTFFAVDSSKVTLLPATLSYEQGAMIEPLAVAVHAVRRFGDIAGKKVAILGAGPIGNLVSQVARSMGAKQVLITDVSDYRLTLAKDCGADYAINTRNRDFNDVLVECFGRDKADVIYDCAGNNITINQAIHAARKGSSIILVAVFADMAQVDLAVLNDHELDLNTTMMYRHEDYKTAISLVVTGAIHLELLMSKVFPFFQYQEAYEFIDANQETCMKVLIDIHNKTK